MELSIKNLTSAERQYVFAQSHQISMTCGLIGHLRAVFEKGQNYFSSAFFDYQKDLQTEEFTSEVNTVIDSLRTNPENECLLFSRKAISRFCDNHPEMRLENSIAREFGIRVNTDSYAYLFRLNPALSEYNFYCYCYKRDWLDHHLKRAERGIRFITPDYKTRFVLSDGDKVRIVSRYGEVRDQVVRYIDDSHMEIGSGLGENLYHICEFAELVERMECKELIPLRSSLPEMCYYALLDEQRIVALERGKRGYASTSIRFTGKEDAIRVVENCNARMGITKAQEEAMKAGAMFGFHVSAADPSNYDASGTLLKKYRERGVHDDR